TWDCGYAAGAARIQYTASSFADSLLRLFAWVLRPLVREPKLTGPFPKPSKFHSETPDVVLDLALVPAIGTTGRAFSWLRWIQLGSIHAYLLYILLPSLILLLWKKKAAGSSNSYPGRPPGGPAAAVARDHQ